MPPPKPDAPAPRSLAALAATSAQAIHAHRTGPAPRYFFRHYVRAWSRSFLKIHTNVPIGSAPVDADMVLEDKPIARFRASPTLGNSGGIFPCLA